MNTWNDGTEPQALEAKINRLETELASAQAVIGRLKTANQQWMEAAAKAGFVFSVGKDAFQISHDPDLAVTIALARADDAEQEIEQLRQRALAAEASCAAMQEAFSAFMKAYQSRSIIFGTVPHGSTCMCVRCNAESSLASDSGKALLAELEELRKDKARLDYLEQNPESGEPIIVYHPPSPDITWKCASNEEYPNLRDAIDAARQSKPETPPAASGPQAQP